MDKFVVRIAAFLKFFVALGAISGAIVIGLGIARVLDLIDMGREFDGVDPALMISAGLGLLVIFAVQFVILRYFITKARNRLARAK